MLKRGNMYFIYSVFKERFSFGSEDSQNKRFQAARFTLIDNKSNMSTDAKFHLCEKRIRKTEKNIHSRIDGSVNK